MGRRRASAACLLALVLGCGGVPVRRAQPRPSPPSHAEYTVTGREDGSAEIAGTFEHVAPELGLAAMDDVRDFFIEGGHKSAGGTLLRAPACAERCSFRYTLPPQGTRVVQSSKVLLLPGNAPKDARVLVRGHAVSALFGEGDERRLLFGKTREGAPFAFGPLRSVALSSELELVVLAPAAFKDPSIFDAWVKDAYAGVTALYGVAPVKTARVFLQPVPGRDQALFGQALTLSGPAVTLLIGTETPPGALHQDWTLVHEMIHLGFPTLIGGRYWMEGLATYFEPIVRARMRWYSPNEAWGELYRGMADVSDTPPLAESRGIDATYWGGAALMLTCDVALRRRTGRSLERLLRQNLHRGRTSSDEMTVEALLTEMDGPDGGQGVLREIFQRHATGSEPLPMKALFESLGVGPAGIFRESAPLAALRQSIMDAP